MWAPKSGWSATEDEGKGKVRRDVERCGGREEGSVDISPRPVGWRNASYSLLELGRIFYSTKSDQALPKVVFWGPTVCDVLLHVPR